MLTQPVLAKGTISMLMVQVSSVTTNGAGYSSPQAVVTGGGWQTASQHQS